MKLEIKNIDIARIVGFLEQTNFKGIASINRSKVTNYLTKQLQEVIEGEKTICEDGKNKPEQWLAKELRTYFDETVTVEGANFLKPLKVIESKIKELTAEDSDKEFSGDEAYALSVLYEGSELGGEADKNSK